MNEQWLIAIGTVILACVALFQDHFRTWLKTPKLEVSTGSVFPYCLRLIFKNKKNPELLANGYGIRIAVRNSKPKCRIKSQAKAVEVYAAKLLKKGNDGQFYPDQGFEPSNLIWSHNFTAYDNISPEMERYCFIGRMLKPSERHHFEEFDDEKLSREELCFRIDTAIPRHTKGHIISQGTYRLDCVVGASNTKTIKKTFEIYISGKWFDDETKMFEEGICIKTL